MEKTDFIKFCQDTKLLDFTARKCVAKVDMGPRKKEENPNEKVEKCGLLISLYQYFQTYRAYRPYVSVVFDTPKKKPKLVEKEVKYSLSIIYLIKYLVQRVSALLWGQWVGQP